MPVVQQETKAKENVSRVYIIVRYIFCGYPSITNNNQMWYPHTLQYIAYEENP